MSVSMESRRGDWLGRCSSFLPAFDLLLLVVLFLVIAGTSLWLAVNHFVLPVADVQAVDAGRLDTARRTLRALAALNREAQPEIRLPAAAARTDASVLDQLRRIGLDAKQLSDADGHIRGETERLLNTLLRNRLQQQLAFWNRQADLLCDLGEPKPQSPLVPVDAGLDRYLSVGREMDGYRDAIWAQHERCVVSVKQTIGEDLLRFKYDRDDAFDMSPEQVNRAKQEIRDLVDRYRDLRNIYVEGHTDPIGPEQYNYKLSFNRALYVANIIRLHLDGQGLTEGKDYFLTVAGYSKRRPLPQKSNETVTRWHSRLRRIELGFQRILPSQRRAPAGAPG